MSAYLVDRSHIEYLVYTLMDFNSSCHMSHLIGTKRHEEIAEILWNENAKSVSYRCPGDPCHAPKYIRKGIIWSYDEAQILQSIRCYEYQSCEHPEYKQSLAKKLMDAMKDLVISRICDGKKWGAPGPLGTSNSQALVA